MAKPAPRIHLAWFVLNNGSIYRNNAAALHISSVFHDTDVGSGHRTAASPSVEMSKVLVTERRSSKHRFMIHRIKALRKHACEIVDKFRRPKIPEPFPIPAEPNMIEYVGDLSPSTISVEPTVPANIGDNAEPLPEETIRHSSRQSLSFDTTPRLGDHITGSHIAIPSSFRNSQHSDANSSQVFDYESGSEDNNHYLSPVKAKSLPEDFWVLFDTGTAHSFVISKALDRLGPVRLRKIPEEHRFGYVSPLNLQHIMYPERFCEMNLHVYEIDAHIRPRLRIMEDPGGDCGYHMLVGRDWIQKNPELFNQIQKSNMENPRPAGRTKRIVAPLRKMTRSTGMYRVMNKRYAPRLVACFRPLMLSAQAEQAHDLAEKKALEEQSRQQHDALYRKDQIGLPIQARAESISPGSGSNSYLAYQPGRRSYLAGHVPPSSAPPAPSFPFYQGQQQATPLPDYRSDFQSQRSDSAYTKYSFQSRGTLSTTTSWGSIPDRVAKPGEPAAAPEGSRGVLLRNDNNGKQ